MDVDGSSGTAQPTPDGRYVVVNGRRWRATDPSIPEPLRTQLVNELMRARRLVKSEGASARHRVQDAKVALGERGRPWWEPRDAETVRERLAAAICALLREREPSTICPSDAARAVGGKSWRGLTATARSVAAELERSGHVVITQKGKPVDVETARGPVRIAPGPDLGTPRT